MTEIVDDAVQIIARGPRQAAEAAAEGQDEAPARNFDPRIAELINRAIDEMEKERYDEAREVLDRINLRRARPFEVAWVEQIYRDNRSNPKGSFSTPFQFQWVVGARSEEEALAIARKFSLEGVCERVQCPFLTVHGEEDRVVAVDSAHKLHAALGTQRKTLKIFSRAEGAAEHVQVDDRQRGVDYIADWLADNL